MFSRYMNALSQQPHPKGFLSFTAEKNGSVILPGVNMKKGILKT